MQESTGHLQGRASVKRLSSEVFASSTCISLLNGAQKPRRKELSQGNVPPSVLGSPCAPGVLERIQEALPISAPGCLVSSEEQMPALWALCGSKPGDWR